jgi:hypothetical protein
MVYKEQSWQQCYFYSFILVCGLAKSAGEKMRNSPSISVFLDAVNVAWWRLLLLLGNGSRLRIGGLY